MKLKAIAKAVLVAGTLDILSAIILTVIAGRSIVRMLAGIAAGPFGDAMLDTGFAGAAIGMATHYALMSAMVTFFAWLATRNAQLTRSPILVGTVYGVAIYVFMYWIVLPLRWPGSGGALTFDAFVIPVLVHITLVGLPISLIVSDWHRSDRRADDPRGSTSGTTDG